MTRYDGGKVGDERQGGPGAGLRPIPLHVLPAALGRALQNSRGACTAHQPAQHRRRHAAHGTQQPRSSTAPRRPQAAAESVEQRAPWPPQPHQRLPAESLTAPRAIQRRHVRRARGVGLHRQPVAHQGAPAEHAGHGNHAARHRHCRPARGWVYRWAGCWHGCRGRRSAAPPLQPPPLVPHPACLCRRACQGVSAHPAHQARGRDTRGAQGQGRRQGRGGVPRVSPRVCSGVLAAAAAAARYCWSAARLLLPPRRRRRLCSLLRLTRRAPSRSRQARRHPLLRL